MGAMSLSLSAPSCEGIGGDQGQGYPWNAATICRDVYAVVATHGACMRSRQHIQHATFDGWLCLPSRAAFTAMPIVAQCGGSCFSQYTHSRYHTSDYTLYFHLFSFHTALVFTRLCRRRVDSQYQAV